MTLVAAASVTPKVLNQDAFALIRRLTPPSFTGVAVADGLGSHFGAERASRMAVEALREVLPAVESPDESALHEAFAEAHARIRTLAASDPARGPDAFGTTLLLGVETPNHMRLAYCGNGNVLHIRGNFVEFPESVLVPWCAQSLMNPHARPERGKNALYKYLSPFVNASAADPSIVTLTKDRLYGDILLLCSDGISSSDQVTVGNDPEGQTWILHEAPVTKLLTFLRQLLLEREAPAEGDLQKGLERCLKELPLDDDATVAILVTDKAVDHARNIANSRRP